MARRPSVLHEAGTGDGLPYIFYLAANAVTAIPTKSK
jgi:hypothetical protein